MQRASILASAFYLSFMIMKSLRCISLLMVALLSACDADKTPPPPPKVTAVAPVVAPVAAPQSKGVPAPEPIEQAAADAPAVHALTPNVPTVRVVAASKPDAGKSESAAKNSSPSRTTDIEQRATSANARSAKVKADNAEIANRAPVASKSKTPAQVVKDTHLPKASLDLSLPPEMVKQLTPPANVITAGPKTKAPAAAGKPLLPKLFPDSNAESDFELQGRLLSNEMQLQLRNEARKEVDGAAVDFTFKQ
ncbi:translation initiation factor 2 [Pseudomonas sp. LS-2]|jgi:hypothetical protein|nr:translation initiation factor 2 [Pseudomonas sp. LS-2]